jgi:hypothetical protein
MPIGRLCRGVDGRCPDNAIVTMGFRCSACETAENRRQHNPLYDSAWRRLSKRTIAQWIRERGPWCPGDPPRHDAHPSFDLTLDHGDQAGVPTDRLDRGRLRVMCRSWNSSLGRR